ncbi:transporter associated domain-containing protein [Roseinatronobacter monicus]|uniref:Magnesium and cobalt transporter n=1 Tax=Roseinatronobacter monicus TaxID=393481 RepID=A0A543KDS2_9RHOB|nr:transporter associated domain-containing protein [Roseinatronobacter monicus]TQM93233.1 magnesium and cobalt transporter [Roseinatronobacter monicus]
MGDTTDGSRAAHRALEDLKESYTRGLFGRLFDALTPDDEDDPERAHALGQTLPGLANLQRLKVEDVAIPKAEIIALEQGAELPDIVATFRESGYSRIPVYDETLDKPLGLLLLKDLALRYGFNGHHAIDLRAILRPILYVPPSMPLSVLLRKMQAERTHFALVIDEYGGVDGLVTIEDLLEQVVGEIEDEHDTEDEADIVRESSASLLANARAPLAALEEELGFALTDEDEEEEIDTLGGLVFLLSGRVPVRGEVIAHPSGLEFEVIDAEPRRIKRLRVHLPETLRDAAQ